MRRELNTEVDEVVQRVTPKGNTRSEGRRGVNAKRNESV